ncbi:MAG TPA: hydroxymyristoyl-ACP dehydratase [Burkholderiaceae bacterium]|nr:hydroxymyristoyl-ACP dehydratase [Burkholderiaceae bacterium]HQR75769.1 hydroxymyristoyl-ACP dehydratase [Burkholderiaceae bacterium]
MSNPRLDRAAIAARIPHAGAMCLLHEVVAWNDGSIECLARSHRDPANPLRSRGRLAAVHGIEYAAQAMALHGALLGGEGSPATRPGYIGAVRALELHAPRLDDIADDLTVHAERLAGDATHALYAFSISAGERLLAEGRISVALGVAA